MAAAEGAPDTARDARETRDDTSGEPASSPGEAQTGRSEADPGADPGIGGDAAEKPAEDQSSLPLVALRDVAIVAGLLSLFAGAQAWATTSGLVMAELLSTLDGFLVGAAVGALAHEWGHFAGVRQAGGIAPLRSVGDFLPLYDYDYARNDARSFLWMSVGGNVAHVLVVIVLLASLPLDTLGTAALVSGAFGFAVFSSTVELPVIQRARAGMDPLEALRGIPRDFVSRYLPWSIGAALLAFIVL